MHHLGIELGIRSLGNTDEEVPNRKLINKYYYYYVFVVVVVKVVLGYSIMLAIL